MVMPYDDDSDNDSDRLYIDEGDLDSPKKQNTGDQNYIETIASVPITKTNCLSAVRNTSTKLHPANNSSLENNRNKAIESSLNKDTEHRRIFCTYFSRTNKVLSQDNVLDPVAEQPLTHFRDTIAVTEANQNIKDPRHYRVIDRGEANNIYAISAKNVDTVGGNNIYTIPTNNADTVIGNHDINDPRRYRVIERGEANNIYAISTKNADTETGNNIYTVPTSNADKVTGNHNINELKHYRIIERGEANNIYAISKKNTDTETGNNIYTVPTNNADTVTDNHNINDPRQRRLIQRGEANNINAISTKKLNTETGNHIFFIRTNNEDTAARNNIYLIPTNNSDTVPRNNIDYNLTNKSDTVLTKNTYEIPTNNANEIANIQTGCMNVYPTHPKTSSNVNSSNIHISEAPNMNVTRRASVIVPNVANPSGTVHFGPPIQNYDGFNLNLPKANHVQVVPPSNIPPGNIPKYPHPPTDPRLVNNTQAANTHGYGYGSPAVNITRTKIYDGTNQRSNRLHLNNFPANATNNYYLATQTAQNNWPPAMTVNGYGPLPPTAMISNRYGSIYTGHEAQMYPDAYRGQMYHRHFQAQADFYRQTINQTTQSMHCPYPYEPVPTHFNPPYAQTSRPYMEYNMLMPIQPHMHVRGPMPIPRPDIYGQAYGRNAPLDPLNRRRDREDHLNEMRPQDIMPEHRNASGTEAKPNRSKAPAKKKVKPTTIDTNCNTVDAIGENNKTTVHNARSYNIPNWETVINEKITKPTETQASTEGEEVTLAYNGLWPSNTSNGPMKINITEIPDGLSNIVITHVESTSVYFEEPMDDIPNAISHEEASPRNASSQDKTVASNKMPLSPTMENENEDNLCNEIYKNVHGDKMDIDIENQLSLIINGVPLSPKRAKIDDQVRRCEYGSPSMSRTTSDRNASDLIVKLPQNMVNRAKEAGFSEVLYNNNETCKNSVTNAYLIQLLTTNRTANNNNSNFTNQESHVQTEETTIKTAVCRNKEPDNHNTNTTSNNNANIFTDNEKGVKRKIRTNAESVKSPTAINSEPPNQKAKANKNDDCNTSKDRNQENNRKLNESVSIKIGGNNILQPQNVNHESNNNDTTTINKERHSKKRKRNSVITKPNIPSIFKHSKPTAKNSGENKNNRKKHHKKTNSINDETSSISGETQNIHSSYNKEKTHEIRPNSSDNDAGCYYTVQHKSDVYTASHSNHGIVLIIRRQRDDTNTETSNRHKSTITDENTSTEANKVSSKNHHRTNIETMGANNNDNETVNDADAQNGNKKYRYGQKHSRNEEPNPPYRRKDREYHFDEIRAQEIMPKHKHKNTSRIQSKTSKEVNASSKKPAAVDNTRTADNLTRNDGKESVDDSTPDDDFINELNMVNKALEESYRILKEKCTNEAEKFTY